MPLRETYKGSKHNLHAVTQEDLEASDGQPFTRDGEGEEVVEGDDSQPPFKSARPRTDAELDYLDRRRLAKYGPRRSKNNGCDEGE